MLEPEATATETKANGSALNLAEKSKATNSHFNTDIAPSRNDPNNGDRVPPSRPHLLFLPNQAEQLCTNISPKISPKLKDDREIILQTLSKKIII